MRVLLSLCIVACSLTAQAQTVRAQANPTAVEVRVAVPRIVVQQEGPEVVVVQEPRRQFIAVDPVAPPAEGPSPMGPGEFAGLKSSIAAEAFPRNKISVLRTAVAANYFTIAQVGELVDLYTFSKDKVEAVSLTRDRILDRGNAFALFAHFTFNADKQKVRALLGQ